MTQKRSSSPMRKGKGLFEEIAMTPAHVAGIWVFVTIAFLVVCICVLGGRYKGLAMRHFDDVDVDGKLRLSNTLERKVIVGYTPVFSTADNTSGQLFASGYFYDSKTTSSNSLGGRGTIPGGAVTGLNPSVPNGGLIIPAGYLADSVYIKTVGAPANPIILNARINIAVSSTLPRLSPGYAVPVNNANGISLNPVTSAIPLTGTGGVTFFNGTANQDAAFQLNSLNVRNFLSNINTGGVNILGSLNNNIPNSDQAPFYVLSSGPAVANTQYMIIFNLVKVI